eukprot:Gb_07618 [translate_table: standard]
MLVYKQLLCTSVTHNYKEWSPVTITGFTESSFLSTLDEPGPLGLTLRKTHSLLDLIQMRLSKGDTTSSETINDLNQKSAERKDVAAQTSAAKLRASNFPASILKIGTWERVSRYEGDLVVKCFFAKRKLVWEVLDRGLKRKIEIDWSDITALKAIGSESEQGVLEVEVSRSPLFFRETSPQPRKHSLWQATSDFTGGQATISRLHCLQFSQGILNRHFEKIIQCDPRLNLLSKGTSINQDFPSFDSTVVSIRDQSEQKCYQTVQDNKCHEFPQFSYLKNDYLPAFPSFPGKTDTTAPILVPKPIDLEGRKVTLVTLCLILVMDSSAIEESGGSANDDLNLKGSVQWDQLVVSTPFECFLDQCCGSQLSPSLGSSGNQIGSCCSEQCISYNSFSTAEDTWPSNRMILDEIAQNLLGDSLTSLTSNEQLVIARVNSLCSLLPTDVSAVPISQPTLSFEDSVTSYGLAETVQIKDGNEVADEAYDIRAVGSEGSDQINYLFHRLENGSTTCTCKTDFYLPPIASFPKVVAHASNELIVKKEHPWVVGRKPV